jgi:hypothetical protein
LRFEFLGLLESLETVSGLLAAFEVEAVFVALLFSFSLSGAKFNETAFLLTSMGQHNIGEIKRIRLLDIWKYV